MHIKMLQTRRGSEDGLRVRCYEAGRIYDLAEDLARAFIIAGSAKALAPAPAKNTTRQKKNKKKERL